MNKRGISAVVATVLIILLVLVSVSVVWIGVRPLISGTSEQITAECLTLNIEPITCSTNQQGETTVRVRRNAGQGSLTEIRFLFDREENPISLTKSANINELETMAFTFNNSEVSNPEFIEIAAIIDDANVCNPVPRKISCRQENPPLPLSCPFGNNITNYQTCDYRFMQQDKYSSINLSKYGMANNSWSMSGGFILALRYKLGSGGTEDETVDDFLSWTEQEIRGNLNFHQANTFPQLKKDTTDLILIDIEHPVTPRHLGLYYLNTSNVASAGQFEEIVEALKLRIRIVKEEFPNAKISLYETIHPPIHGNDSRQDFQDSMLGYLEASKLGLYDDLDYLSPLLYARYGLRDPIPYERMGNITEKGIEHSLRLKKSDNTPIPLMPLLTVRVLEGGSLNNGEMVDPGITNQIIKLAQKYPEVEIISFWSATDLWIKTNNEPTINSTEFFDQTKPVPSSCFCGL